jgi:hypothetical protein
MLHFFVEVDNAILLVDFFCSSRQLVLTYLWEEKSLKFITVTSVSESLYSRVTQGGKPRSCHLLTQASEGLADALLVIPCYNSVICIRQ